MTRPREARSCGRSCWVRAIGPKKSTSNWSRQSVSGSVSIGPTHCAPALLTIAWSLPLAAILALTAHCSPVRAMLGVGIEHRVFSPARSLGE